MLCYFARRLTLADLSRDPITNKKVLIQDGDIPCSAGASDSFCCPIYFSCMDNGLCSKDNTTNLLPYGNLKADMQGSYIDGAWETEQRPSICIGKSSIRKGHGKLEFVSTTRRGDK